MARSEHDANVALAALAADVMQAKRSADDAVGGLAQCTADMRLILAERAYDRALRRERARLRFA